ncbi:MAG TPA: hypothetical protein VGH11_07605 [Jatrophihabitans sp.]|jgi:hypothetical protein
MTSPALPWWGDGPEPASDWSDPTGIKSAQRGHYQRLSDYAHRWPAQPGEDELALSEHSVTSQNGEDGVLAEVFSRIGITRRAFIEFGVENGDEGNCVCLADHRGWSGWFLEADAEQYRQLSAKYAWNDRVQTARSMVTASNVNTLFGELGVPDTVDVASIDIDGADFQVWRALTITRPRVVVVEYNSALDPSLALVPRDPGASWDGTQNYGSSLGAMISVGDEKGYDLIYLESCGVNAFFLDRAVDWSGAKNDDVIRRTPNYFLTRKHHPGFDPTLESFVPLPSPGARTPGTDPSEKEA